MSTLFSTIYPTSKILFWIDFSIHNWSIAEIGIIVNNFFPSSYPNFNATIFRCKCVVYMPFELLSTFFGYVNDEYFTIQLFDDLHELQDRNSKVPYVEHICYPIRQHYFLTTWSDSATMGFRYACKEILVLHHFLLKVFLLCS